MESDCFKAFLMWDRLRGARAEWEKISQTKILIFEIIMKANIFSVLSMCQALITLHIFIHLKAWNK